jgi:hypothetical protein
MECQIWGRAFGYVTSGLGVEISSTESLLLKGFSKVIPVTRLVNYVCFYVRFAFEIL